MNRFPVITRMARDAAIPLGLAILVLGCAMQPPAERGSLYERLDGMPTLDAVAGEAVEAVSTDPRIGRAFDGIRAAPMKTGIAAHLCEMAGGSCRHDVDTTHQARGDPKITDEEFDRLVAATRAALEKRVGEREKNELLRLLAPMKRDIVGA